MKQFVTRQEMEGFARLLEWAKQRQALPLQVFNDLHAGFRATDDGGTAWTVGNHTRKWHHRVRDQWLSADPPEGLYLEDEVFMALRELMAQAAKTTDVRDNPKPAAQGLLCSRCGAEVKPGKKFCGVCGGPMTMTPPSASVEQRCPQCRQTVPAGEKFCTTCGAGMR